MAMRSTGALMCSAVDQIVVSRGPVEVPQFCASCDKLLCQIAGERLSAAQDLQAGLSFPAGFNSRRQVIGVACMMVISNSCSRRANAAPSTTAVFGAITS